MFNPIHSFHHAITSFTTPGSQDALSPARSFGVGKDLFVAPYRPRHDLRLVQDSRHRHRERECGPLCTLGSLQRALPLGALQSREIHRRHRYLRKCRHGGYHHRQHLPLLGLPAGFPRQSARQLLCQLGQGYAPAERLYPADSQLLVPCDLYDAKQAGVCAQRAQRQDDPRESGAESRTAGQCRLRVHHRIRCQHETLCAGLQGPHGAFRRKGGVSAYGTSRDADSRLVQPMSNPTIRKLWNKLSCGQNRTVTAYCPLRSVKMHGTQHS